MDDRLHLIWTAGALLPATTAALVEGAGLSDGFPIIDLLQGRKIGDVRVDMEEVDADGRVGIDHPENGDGEAVVGAADGNFLVRGIHYLFFFRFFYF